MRRPKVAIVHPKLGFGGSETRALWLLEALKRDYDVCLITGGKVDLLRLNEYYGTRLSPQEFSIREVRMPLGLQGTAKFAGLRRAFLQRYLKRVSLEFDVMISGYNPCDFGIRGIQCIGDFAFVREWRLALHPSLQNYRRWWYGDSPLRNAYLAFCNLVSKPNPDAWKRNVTVANSGWSAGCLRREFGIEARTVYPPVADDFPAIPYQEKENGFVCIGRVVPEKRMDAIIELLGRVREDGCDIHLHLLGGIDDSQYGRRLKQLCAKHHDWVFPEGLVFGRRKKELMARHRFGINACENESFGIAVAEMVKAGCIVFVPNGGGQVEIVNHPALIYEDDADAVRKIEAVLANAALQGSLREHLSQGAQRFSVSNFQGAMQNLVREFLEGEKGVVAALKVG
jgi:glycosyltransferase involved in cell wall biosynthesis